MSLPNDKIIELIKKSGKVDPVAIEEAEKFIEETKAQDKVAAYIESHALTEEVLGGIIANYQEWIDGQNIQPHLLNLLITGNYSIQPVKY